MVAITPYGLHGPYAGRPYTEITLQAESGALAVRGHPSREPVQAGGRTMEWVSGLYAAVAALAATRVGAPRRTRRARRPLDVGGRQHHRHDRRRPHGLPAGPPESGEPGRSFETPSIEPTSDGYVGFNTNTRTQFDSFLLMIERPDLVEDGSWAPISARIVNWEEWNGIVHEWTTQHTTAEVVALAAELRIPVAPVSDGPAVVDARAGGRARLAGRRSDRHVTACRADRGRSTARCHPRRGPRLAWASTPARSSPGRPRSPRPHGPELPLAGVKVLDLTAWWAGPSASAMLAALGADVVHVESVTRPDGMRFTSGVSAGPRPLVGVQRALPHLEHQQARPHPRPRRGPRAARSRCASSSSADLVVENYTPRVIEQFDLGWDVVHATNPAR